MTVLKKEVFCICKWLQKYKWVSMRYHKHLEIYVVRDIACNQGIGKTLEVACNRYDQCLDNDMVLVWDGVDEKTL